MPKNFREEGNTFPIKAQHEHRSLIQIHSESCPESVTTAGDLPGTSTLRGSNTAAEETEPFLHAQQFEAQAPRE